MSALSKKQKAYLAGLSERAFNLAAAKARGAGEEMTTDWRARGDWRREQVAVACGKAGLRCCGQLDYAAVEAHFLGLLGETKRAFEAHVRSATEERRQADAVLLRETEKAGLSPMYVEAICRRQFRCPVMDANAKQLWCLVYTVRNRAAAKRRRAV